VSVHRCLLCTLQSWHQGSPSADRSFRMSVVNQERCKFHAIGTLGVTGEELFATQRDHGLHTGRTARGNGCCYQCGHAK
jgi:hypothetical protein